MRRPSDYDLQRILLHVGMAAPLIAFAITLIAVIAYPGFNHANQYLSELGGAKAKAPWIFNSGVFVSGVLAAVSGVGFGLATAKLGGSRTASALTTTCFLAAGYGMAVSSIYHWPDPRHLAINLGLGIILAPVLMLWALTKVRGVVRLRWFLLGAMAAMAVLAVVTRHLVLPHLVNDDNVGWWERVFAIVLVGWTGVAAYVLERRLRETGES